MKTRGHDTTQCLLGSVSEAGRQEEDAGALEGMSDTGLCIT